MLDPLILKLVSVCFALLFLLAAVHKLTAFETFRTTLGAYELLPHALIYPASMVVPVIEAVLGIAWLLAVAPVTTAVMSIALLGTYTTAIATNILRGRIHIDCGCSMASSAGRDQQLSWGLVARNSLLIVIAMAATLPASERAIGTVDYVILVAGLLAVALLYGAVNQLLSNGAAISTWRKRHE